MEALIVIACLVILAIPLTVKNPQEAAGLALVIMFAGFSLGMYGRYLLKSRSVVLGGTLVFWTASIIFAFMTIKNSASVIMSGYSIMGFILIILQFLVWASGFLKK
jgi:hypothetical protein